MNPKADNGQLDNLHVLENHVHTEYSVQQPRFRAGPFIGFENRLGVLNDIGTEYDPDAEWQAIMSTSNYGVLRAYGVPDSGLMQAKAMSSRQILSCHIPANAGQVPMWRSTRTDESGFCRCMAGCA